MKKKFVLLFVVFVSVVFFAVCGEVKFGVLNAVGNLVDEKIIKIGFNFEEIGVVAVYGIFE